MQGELLEPKTSIWAKLSFALCVALPATYLALESAIPLRLHVVDFIECGMSVLQFVAIRLYPIGLLSGIVALVQILWSKGSVRGYGYLAGTLLSLACVAVVLYVLISFGNALRDDTIVEENNLIELASAAWCYARDHDGQMPSVRDWNAKLCPSEKDRSMLICPEVRGRIPCYAVNKAFAGRSLWDVDDPDRVVLLFESIPGKNLCGGAELIPAKPRHKGKLYVCFADTGVELCTPGEVKELLSRRIRR